MPEKFEAAQYTLRAGFFYRAHGVWSSTRQLVIETAVGRLRRLGSASGVSGRALERVRELNLSPHVVFAHPDFLVKEPRSIQYYRNLALLPQKGLQRLAFGTVALESGRGRLSRARAQLLAKVLNGLISLQIESNPEWTFEKAETAALLNLGSQINGSWRNAIGGEGSRQIRGLLTSILAEEGVIATFEFADGRRVQPPLDAALAAELVRTILVKNGCTVTFAPEPDVSVRDATGLLVGTMEVKYGSDPAGALERYGAARKSFEAAVRENARVQNLYIANAITAEVRKRIDEDRLVSGVFEFTRLSVDAHERARFLRFVTRRLLDV